jgi:hypothetical protein
LPWQISNQSARIHIFHGPGVIWEVLPAQIETPIRNLKKSISDFFKNLQKTIASMKGFGMPPSGLIFHGQGNVPIPESFKKFCRKHDINIFVFSPEQDDYGLSELPYQKLEDELPELKGIFTGMAKQKTAETIQF